MIQLQKCHSDINHKVVNAIVNTIFYSFKMCIVFGLVNAINQIFNPRTAQPFVVELPVSSQDGFLGSPLRLRSSTRACSTGLTSGRPSPT